MKTEGLDIGRIVGLIMENPTLIEQIASLGRKDGDQKQKESPTEPKNDGQDESCEQNNEVREQKNEGLEPSKDATYPTERRTPSDRARLFYALKPYLSEERGRAIDSMISIGDILDMMRAR